MNNWFFSAYRSAYLHKTVFRLSLYLCFAFFTSPLVVVKIMIGAQFSLFYVNFPLFLVQNVRYLNGPPSHVTTNWIPDTHVSGIQIVQPLKIWKHPDILKISFQMVKIQDGILKSCNHLNSGINNQYCDDIAPMI